jgi:hypothetical protein
MFGSERRARYASKIVRTNQLSEKLIRVMTLKMAVFWDITPRSLVEVYQQAIISLMMEAASTSEKSVNFYQPTRRNIPEDSHLHTRRRENLKSHQDILA